jgi:Cysteine-rich secretory protein family
MCELSSVPVDKERVATHSLYTSTTGGGNYGQNMAAGIPPENVAQAIAEFVNEGNDYKSYGKESLSAGHFTQVVWKGTSSVACATQKCSGGVKLSYGPPYLTVCNYRAPGMLLDYSLFDAYQLTQNRQHDR